MCLPQDTGLCVPSSRQTALTALRYWDAFEAQYKSETDEARVAEAPIKEVQQEAPSAPPAETHNILNEALPAEEIVEEPPILNENAILDQAFLNDVSFLDNIDLSFLDNDFLDINLFT